MKKKKEVKEKQKVETQKTKIPSPPIKYFVAFTQIREKLCPWKIYY